MTTKQISSPEKYSIMEYIDKGSFGELLKIEIIETKEIFALKTIDLSNSMMNTQKRKEILEEANQEFAILSKKLRNVVPGYGLFWDETDGKLNYSMEFYPHNLAKFIQKSLLNNKREIFFSEFLPIFKNIVTGLNSLRENNIIHKDIKPENILINEKGEAFISDVGAAKVFDSTKLLKNNESVQTITRITHWMAPEMKFLNDNKSQPILQGKISHAKLDIFSLGLMTLYCLDSCEFTQQSNLNEDPNLLLEEYFKKFNKGNNSGKPKIPKDFYYMLRCMLSYDYNTRPKIEELNQDIARFIKSKKVIKTIIKRMMTRKLSSKKFLYN